MSQIQLNLHFMIQFMGHVHIFNILPNCALAQSLSLIWKHRIGISIDKSEFSPLLNPCKKMCRIWEKGGVWGHVHLLTGLCMFCVAFVRQMAMWSGQTSSTMSWMPSLSGDPMTTGVTHDESSEYDRNKTLLHMSVEGQSVITYCHLDKLHTSNENFCFFVLWI